ncbi:MAG: enoyl-CoA hydratase/isomerase family protein [Dermatophilaceae bacterium]|nr:enoyl-CoA hydratase/isomerase family protein [Intrasporangiaceae bacterium]
MTTPDESPVVTERAGAVCTIRLNRPDAMNALDIAAKEALRDAVSAAAQDDSIRCVVLTGTGRAFCVGQDLREHVAGLEQGADFLATTVAEHYNPIATMLASMNKPVVTAINGVAAGAGMSFALTGDIRIMAEGAGMNTAFGAIALSCDSGASWWLPRLVGHARAKDLLFFPRTIPAAECLELGLVTSVVPADEFGDAVLAAAQRLAAGPTQAYGAMRQAILASSATPLPEALDVEESFMASTGDTADHHEAVRAFLAKETPTFTGR